MADNQPIMVRVLQEELGRLDAIESWARAYREAWGTGSGEDAARTRLFEALDVRLRPPDSAP